LELWRSHRQLYSLQIRFWLANSLLNQNIPDFYSPLIQSIYAPKTKAFSGKPGVYGESKNMSHKGEAYSASGSIFLDNPIRRLVQPPSELIDKLGVTQSDVTLDFGCGPGFFTTELAKRTKKVFSVDISSEMLQKAKNKAAKPK
jgi:SAM-dependent methyltransferase